MTRHRFGAFEFDGESGELRPVDGGDTTRLPPQPAKLLAVLIEHRGDVVDRETIRSRIWPDVEVDFDAGLHFCIRQIRSALGDTAGAPVYIETLPRRGYRLIPPVEPADRGRHGNVAVGRFGRWTMALASLGLVTLILLATAALTGGSAPDPPPLRIGVMSFRPQPGAADRFGAVPEIAEWVLAEVARLPLERAEVVGPTTTAAYESLPGGLTELAESYDLDFIVNGRFLVDGDQPRMLAELIRCDDGAHVWVEAYTALEDGQAIGREIGTEVLARLDAGELE